MASPGWEDTLVAASREIDDRAVNCEDGLECGNVVIGSRGFVRSRSFNSMVEGLVAVKIWPSQGKRNVFSFVCLFCDTWDFDLETHYTEKMGFLQPNIQISFLPIERRRCPFSSEDKFFHLLYWCF